MSALIIANWKMNGALPAIETFADKWQALGADNLAGVQTVICPPFTYLSVLHEALPSVQLGGQDCSSHVAGAYTGEVSADMLAEIGCDWVIVGHSERREYHGESDEMVALKAQRGQSAGLTVVVCVGESLAQREAGKHRAVVAEQMAGSLAGVRPANLVVAYEPVWAIGTGVTASPEQADEMHQCIRQELSTIFGDEAAQIAVIYGGSVKPETAGDLFACDTIDGALVGGASLEAESFYAIAQAAGAGRT